MWNPKNFKGHVSPYEFMEAVSLASGKRFRCDDQEAGKHLYGGQADPIQFLAWIFNAFDKEMRRVVEKTFRGTVQVTTMKREGSTQGSTDYFHMDKKESKFFYLTLDLPTMPLFKE